MKRTATMTRAASVFALVVVLILANPPNAHALLFGGGMREDRGGFQKARVDGVHEIGRGYALQGTTDVVESKQVAHDNFCSRPREFARAVIVGPHEHPHRMASIEQQLSCPSPGLPGCPSHQKLRPFRV